MKPLVAIAGGSGFIGKALTENLLASGSRVLILTRGKEISTNRPNLFYSQWSPKDKYVDHEVLKGITSVVNLAGASIDRRWTARNRDIIFQSRVQSTRFLLDRVTRESPHCMTFVSASGIGYYGSDDAGEQKSPPRGFREESKPHLSSFMGYLSDAWENEALKASTAGMRTFIPRLGVVLGRTGGAFPAIMRPFRLGITPIFGTGNQIYSWIHLKDVIRALQFVLTDPSQPSGVFNLVSPFPVPYNRLIRAIKAHAKTFMPYLMELHLTDRTLELLLGQVASELTKSCTVSSEKFDQSFPEFQFKFPLVEQAVADLLN